MEVGGEGDYIPIDTLSRVCISAVLCCNGRPAPAS